MGNKNKQNKRDYFSNKNEICFPERQIESDALERVTPYSLGCMHDQIIKITKSNISAIQLQFKENCNYRSSNEDVFYCFESIRRNIGDAEAYVTAFNEGEENVKEKFPLSESCLKMLDEYFDGIRPVISGLTSQFEEDKIDHKNDEDIYKILESLKTSLDNINGLFSGLCKSVNKLQA